MLFFVFFYQFTIAAGVGLVGGLYRSWASLCFNAWNRVSSKSFLSTGHKCFHRGGGYHAIHQHFSNRLLPQTTLQETIKFRWESWFIFSIYFSFRTWTPILQNVGWKTRHFQDCHYIRLHYWNGASLIEYFGCFLLYLQETIKV